MSDRGMKELLEIINGKTLAEQYEYFEAYDDNDFINQLQDLLEEWKDEDLQSSSPIALITSIEDLIERYQNSGNS